MILSEEDRFRITESIRKAEGETTGEIRVHIEKTCKGDPLLRARKVFKQLGMEKTQQRNGVLIYIASQDRKAAIFGDEAIALQLPDNFWEEEFEILRTEFANERYAYGLCRVVDEVGAHLKDRFPADAQTENSDELSNEISFGNDSTADTSKGK